MLQSKSPSRLEQLMLRAETSKRDSVPKVSPAPRRAKQPFRGTSAEAQARIQALNDQLEDAQLRERKRRSDAQEMRTRLVALTDRLRAAKQREDKLRAEVIELRANASRSESAAVRSELEVTALRLSRLQASKLGRLQMAIWRARRR